MNNHRRFTSEHRALSAQEVELLRWLLTHGESKALRYIPAVDTIRVVSRCDCGCASIDFVDEPEAPMEVLSDHMWRDKTGHLFGIFAFAKAGRLGGLEVWSVDGSATPMTLPEPAVLYPVQ